MEYPRPNIIIDGVEYKLLSLEEFKAARGITYTSNQALDYNLVNGKLDYTVMGRFRYIIWNEKAQDFSLAYQK